jgi:hypothetical protein
VSFVIVRTCFNYGSPCRDCFVSRPWDDLQRCSYGVSYRGFEKNGRALPLERGPTEFLQNFNAAASPWHPEGEEAVAAWHHRFAC